MFEHDRNENEISARDAAFERALRSAMKRVEAPEALVKFLATAAEAEQARGQSGRLLPWHKPASGGRVLGMPRRASAWVGGAIAAVLALGAFGAEHLHRERMEQRVADQQFAQSEAITQHALEHAREQMQKAGMPLE